jgi:tRNA threonylcarbamoyladenosine biosynthesis protein TsaB
MTKILAFDTSISTCSVAVLEDRKLLYLHTITESGRQAELLIPEIEKALQATKTSYQQLDLISTVKGPGSFTGIRIALSVLRALKLATNLPVILLNSCEVVAEKYRDKSSQILVTIDAGMSEFFCASFVDGKISSEIELLKKDEVIKLLPKDRFLLCGSGKTVIAETLKRAGRLDFSLTEDEDIITADLVGSLAHQKFLTQKSGDEDLSPIYIRKPKIGNC